MKSKSFRVKVYRRQSGPFECVVIATSRAKAQVKAVRKSKINADTVLEKLAHELAPLPVSNTKETLFNSDGTLKSRPSGKPCYPKAWTAGVKLVRPLSLRKGGDKVLAVNIKLIGFAK